MIELPNQTKTFGSLLCNLAKINRFGNTGSFVSIAYFLSWKSGWEL
jgi:hypothetical protein